MATQPDYYAILQIHLEAEKEVVDAAYRKLAAKYHPDVSTSADAVDKMKQLNEAYEVLSDPDRRAAYDSSRGMSPTRESPSGRSWRGFIVSMGMILLVIMAARLGGIRLVLVLAVLVGIVWLVAKMGK